MSQEMFLRKIPEDMRPWECNVNGVKYVYPEGTEQNVPAEVAAIIDAYWEKQAVDYPETGISFNDLRDRPFGESTEVLFDQRVELEDGDGVLSNALGLVVGETYEVTFNGTTYNLIAKPYDMEGTVIGNYIGDTVLAEYPFAIIEVYPEVSAELGVPGDPILMTRGYLESATIRIEKSVIHTIDPKFLPGGGGGKVVYYWDGDSVIVTDANGNEITAEQAAKDVFNVVIYNQSTNAYLFPYKCVVDESYVLFIVLVDTSNPEYLYAGTVPK